MITELDLAEHLGRQLFNTFSGFLQEHTSKDLRGRDGLSSKLESGLRTSLERSCKRIGLEFVAIEHVEFSGAVNDDILAKRADVRRRGEEFEVDKLDHRLEAEVREYGFERETQRLALEREFANLYGGDKREELLREDSFREFVDDVEFKAGVRGLLRQSERDELETRHRQFREDKELAREQLLSLLGFQRKRDRLQAEFDYKSDWLDKKTDLDERQRELMRKRLAEELQDRLSTERAEYEATLQREDLQHAAALARQSADANAGLSQKIAEDGAALSHKVATDKAEHDTDRAAAELALDVLSKAKRLKQEQKDADADREIRVSDAESAREQLRLKAIGELSPTALMAASPAETAKLIADTIRTDTLAKSGLNESQLLAIVAENSPAAAAALSDKFRSEGREELLKQINAELKQSTETQLQSAHSYAVMIKELAEKSLETQRDATSSVAKGAASPPPVVYPPIGMPHATALVCGHCSAGGQSGRFCRQCGGAI
nr:hypothetical protein [Botrimarina hoheduenensis]